MVALGNSVGDRLRFLARDSVLYGLGGALNKAITLITFPLIARHFSVTDFGIIDLLNTTVVLLITLLVFGQDSAVARYFYEYDAPAARRQVVSQSLAFQLGLVALVVPPALFFSRPLAAWMHVGDDGVAIIRLMVLQVPFFLLINFSQGILKWTLRRWPFLFMSVGSTAATLTGLLIALRISELSVVDLFTIYLVVRAAFGLAGVWFIRQWITWPQGWGHLRQMLRFAVPFGVVCAITSLLPIVERNAVVTLIGTDALGIFAAGAKVAMLIGLVINAFETSWGPFSLSIFREPDAARTFSIVLQLAALLLCAAALLLSAGGDLLVVLLGTSKYSGAGQVVFALTMAQAVGAIGAITEVGIIFSKQSHLKLYAYGVGLLVAAATIPLLGSRYGVPGVAWGSLVGYICKAVFEAWLAQRAHQIQWQFAGPIGVCALTLVIGLAHQVWFNEAVVLGVRWIPLVGLAALAGVARLTLPAYREVARLMGQREAAALE